MYLNGKGAVLNVGMTGCLSELTTTSKLFLSNTFANARCWNELLGEHLPSTIYHLPTSILAISLISGERVMKNFAG